MAISNMKHTVQIITVMFLWALCFPLIALGLPYAPHLTFAAMRAFLAGLALLIPSLIMKRPQPGNLKTWLMLGGTGLGATTLGFFGMFHASEFVSPGIATVITNTQPIMAAVIAAIVLKEHLGTRGKAGLLLAFTGVVVIALPSLLSDNGGTFPVGFLYIILSVLGISVSNVLIRLMAGQIDALGAMGWQMLIGSFFLMIIALMTEDVTAVTWNIPFISSLLGLALPGTALAYFLWCRVLKTVELNNANTFSFLMPVFGLVMGVVFYRENIGIVAAGGIGLTLFAIIMVNRPHEMATEREERR